ncbi:MAG: ADP-glyceromanno-heptose 6-epimerase [Candidatus Omnitrophica bacterium]|nr:ADP-glyceromanno-heptose 6-epimerase [Candidatus Omnitrophota bacterium]MBU2251208.1 ADP-glyceromanno-heptose 6-epimerase [Candidatus Omnitrophota bacterium]MBU2473172.1 ADP-glyceromanno-heptose 6-epimerase [Candidatus Omnitrophota bacterium]
MRVLVTGGAGFIGSNVVKILEDQGDKVIVLDNFSHSSYKNLMDLEAEVIASDITDGSIYKKLPKVDAVIHEAAITDTTLADDTKMMTVNYEGSKKVLDFCLAKNIPLVYASSAGVYGETKSLASEDQKLTPHNTYGYSKYLFDCRVSKLIAKKSSPRIVGLRYFNVYGPREYHKGSAASMTYQLYLQMNSGKRPRVFKYGEQKRDFIYVKDVARITVEALKSKTSAILNLGTGTPRSFNDIISSLNQALKTKLEPDYFDNPYGDKYQNFTQADTALLEKTLKTSAQFSLEKGIQDYVNEYL